MSYTPTEEQINSKSRDPLRRLPPELAIEVIRDALPSDGTYTPHLLDFTTVSMEWQNFLFSTPFLWNTLYLDETQHDFLASLATSIHYSADLALKIVLWSNPIANWESLSQVLLPVHGRITFLAIRPPVYQRNAVDKPIFNPLTTLIATLHYLRRLPGLMEIEFDEEFDLRPGEIEQKLPNIAQTLRFRGQTIVGLSEILAGDENALSFDREIKDPGLQTELPTQSKQALSLELLMIERTVTVRVHSTSELLSHINSSTSYLCCGFKLGGILRSFGSHLHEFYASIDSSHLRDLVNCLQLLVNLQILQLVIGIGGHEATEQPLAGDHDVIVGGLQRLNIQLYAIGPVNSVENPLLQRLFRTLSHIYPNVKRVTVDSSMWPSAAFAYIQRSSAMEYLYMAVQDHSGHPPVDLQVLSLPSLEKLAIMNPPAWCRITAPSMLSLVVTVDALGGQLSNLKSTSVVKLIMRSRDPIDCRLLNPFDFPCIREITLEVVRVIEIRSLLSFPHLVSIKLNSSLFYTNPQGNNLCVALLYHSEQCPSLQELHFNLFVEWNLLFLMLERRNFGRKDVQKIHTVSLPYVPFILRQYLYLLLLGESKEKSPLIDASLDAAREVLWDPQMCVRMSFLSLCLSDDSPGCFSCLTNMWPACGFSVGGHYSYAQDPLDLYPEYEHHTSGCPDTRGRINERRYWLNEWVTSYTEFRKHHSRRAYCDRYDRSPGGVD